MRGFSWLGRRGGCGLARPELPPGFDPASIDTASYLDGRQPDAYMAEAV